MPVFGKSLFETVLDGMAVDEVEDEDAEPVLRRPRVSAHFLADTALSEREGDRAFGTLYEDFGAPPDVTPEAVAEPVPPGWLNRLSEQEVANDLGLAAGMRPAEIRERRRAFARDNHPDRVHESFREAATIRMTIANRLAETALRG